MPDSGHLHAARGNTEGTILEVLEPIDGGWFGYGEPDGGSVSEKGLKEEFEGNKEFLFAGPSWCQQVRGGCSDGGRRDE